jgi:hypothetical protein
MPVISKFLEAIFGSRKSPAEPAYGIPTVKFDASRVTEAVRADIKKNIKVIEEIDQNHFDKVYDATIRSESAGGDLYSLSIALMQMNIDGMTKRRAGQIALFLHFKATAVMNREGQISLGIEYARWRYSGAPCEINPKKPTEQEIRQNEAHRDADGKLYEVSKGMFLDGKWTWPGYEDGCKCFSRSLIRGFI